MRGKKKESALTPEEKLAQALIPVDKQPYPVPENWCWIKLSSLSRMISKGTTPIGGKTAYVENGISFLRVENLNENGTVNHEGIAYISEEMHYGYLKRSILESGDILISIAGTLGKTGIVSNEDIPLNTNQAIAFVRLLSPSINKTYIQKSLSTPAIRELLLSQTKVTAIPNLTLEIVGECPIPFAPVTEQRRIVARIESLFAKLDEAREKAQAVLDSFEMRKAAILHKAFSGELTAKWREEQGIGLDTWNQFLLNEVCDEIKVGIVIKPSQYYTEADTGTPAFRSANVRENHIDDFDWVYLNERGMNENKRSIVHSGDVLVVRSGNPGTACVVTEKYDGYNAIDILIAVPNKRLIVSEFLCYYTNSPFGKNLVAENKRGMALAHFNVKGYSALPISLPTIQEQKEVVRLIAVLLKKEQQAKDAAASVIDKIDTMKKSILAKAFRGELGTNDPSEESAMKLLKGILAVKKDEPKKAAPKHIPQQLKQKLKSEVETRIIRLYIQKETEFLSMSEMMDASSNAFEVIDAVHELEKRSIIEKQSNGKYMLLR